MKKKYDSIMIAIENGYKIQVTRNSSYYIVKIGKKHMKNYQKKAQSSKCYDLPGLKDNLQKICSLKSIDWIRVENQLLKALKSSSVGNTPIDKQARVEKGGIWAKVQSMFKLKADNSD